MFRRISVVAVLFLSVAGSARAADLPTPYKNAPADAAYNKLFCDAPGVFVQDGSLKRDAQLDRVFRALAPDTDAVRKIAEDQHASSCTREFAYIWLRLHGKPVPPKKLLGVIVEVSVLKGLDTLAAYQDGRVRYIDVGGRIATMDNPPPAIAAKVKELFARSQPIVAQIGPWNRPRVPQPPIGAVRISFLVSDGLYFGDGKFDRMQADKMGGPAIHTATELITMIAAAARTAH